MASSYLVPLTAAFLVIGAMTGCTTDAHSGKVEVEVRAMAPGAQGNSYEVKIIGPDGDFANSQEVSVGSTYGIEGFPFGTVSVEASSGCVVESELSLESPRLRVVIDGENCLAVN
ncbi:hypothetical protein ACFUCV_13375 [Specibacter sp. NPDC057265]|uniref:hypothetical protein n=1 Tax=Specibacter sp. NPDC057265 TaxID=3346075 RepID=UPI003631797E